MMKKVLLVGILSCISLLASSGQKIFQQNCVSCHTTQKGYEIEDKSKMLAPPVWGIMKHVKAVHPTKEKFVEFVADYIAYPSLEKSKCSQKSLDKFGLMPPIGLSLSKQEREEVSEWLYDLSNKHSVKGCKEEDKK